MIVQVSFNLLLNNNCVPGRSKYVKVVTGSTVDVFIWRENYSAHDSSNICWTVWSHVKLISRELLPPGKFFCNTYSHLFSQRTVNYTKDSYLSAEVWNYRVLKTKQLPLYYDIPKQCLLIHRCMDCAQIVKGPYCTGSLP
jgi:hypothetical protein